MTAAFPETAEQLAELVADPEKYAEVFADPEKGAEAIAHYVGASNKTGVIADQVAEQAAASVMDMLKQNGAGDRPDLSALADDITGKVVAGVHQSNLTQLPNTVYNPRALGAKVDHLYTTPGDFFAAIWHNAPSSADTLAKREAFRNAFSEKVPAEGGFLVPERLRAELLRVALESAIVRPRARVIPMDSLRVPFPAIDDTSHASSVYGGIVGYWTEEGATLTESTPSFGRITLDAKKLTAYAEVPNELMSDSVISFDAFINQVFPEALAWWEDKAFFDGSGAGEPEGFQNAGAVVNVAKESGQAAATVVYENLVKMYARMLPASLNRAVWVANHEVFPQLATMALSVGTGGSAIWIGNGGAANTPPVTIFGRPVIFTEKAEALGTAGDIVFADFSYYLIGDRQSMSARSSEHRNFEKDETVFRVVQRLDGRSWLNSAITPHKGSSTLSPFVRLATRS